MTHATSGVSTGGNVLLSDKDDDYAQFIYCSLVSLTTVGVLFPVIVIARLVGLAASQKS